MTETVMLHHLNELFLDGVLAGDGLKLHECKYREVVRLITWIQSPHSSVLQRF
jgi:hypothetical protein